MITPAALATAPARSLAASPLNPAWLLVTFAGGTFDAPFAVTDGRSGG